MVADLAARAVDQDRRPACPPRPLRPLPVRRGCAAPVGLRGHHCADQRPARAAGRNGVCMIGTTARSSVRNAGDGKGASRTRQNHSSRRAGSQTTRFAGSLSTIRQPKRAHFGLTGMPACANLSSGSSNGKSRLIGHSSLSPPPSSCSNPSTRPSIWGLWSAAGPDQQSMDIYGGEPSLPCGRYLVQPLERAYLWPWRR